MSRFPYTKGLHKLADNVYAYLQPDGSWGLSNAGVILDKKKALLIDTFYDLGLTSEFLADIKNKIAADIIVDRVINTHANGDHWYGNSLVKGAEIISSEKCRDEMKELPPAKMNLLMSLSFLLGKGGKFAKECFKRFNYKKIEPVYPSTVFSGKLEITYGDTPLHLIETGPAHTKGDIIVVLPKQKIVFAADILFIGGMPIFWDGPAANMIKACDTILEAKPDIIVPGHGPVTDKKGVEKVKQFYIYIFEETKKRFEKGMPVLDAALDIDISSFELREKERIAANVYTIYNELDPDRKRLGAVQVFGLMAAYREKSGMKK